MCSLRIYFYMVQINHKNFMLQNNIQNSIYISPKTCDVHITLIHWQIHLFRLKYSYQMQHNTSIKSWWCKIDCYNTHATSNLFLNATYGQWTYFTMTKRSFQSWYLHFYSCQLQTARNQYSSRKEGHYWT